ILSNRSGMPLALVSSRMSPLGMQPVPCAPVRPTRSRCRVSLVVSPVSPETHPTVGRSNRYPSHQSGYFPVACIAISIDAASDFPRLVTRAQQSLAILRARVMKCQLLLVGLIMRKPVLENALALNAFEVLEDCIELVRRDVLEVDVFEIHGQYFV